MSKRSRRVTANLRHSSRLPASRQKLGELSNKIINWWLRVYDVAQPHEGRAEI